MIVNAEASGIEGTGIRPGAQFRARPPEVSAASVDRALLRADLQPEQARPGTPA